MDNFTNILLTISAIGTFYVVRKFTSRLSPSIPFAGEQSVLARLKVPIEYGKDPVHFLCKTRRSLGDVFCVDLFVVKIVFLLGPEGNKAVLRAPEDELSFWEQVRWAMGPVLERGKSSIHIPRPPCF